MGFLADISSEAPGGGRWKGRGLRRVLGALAWLNDVTEDARVQMLGKEVAAREGKELKS